MSRVEVSFSPLFFPLVSFEEPTIIVVIDVLRATTSFCTAFDYGAKAIIPLDSLESAVHYKNLGHLVAAEREGLKPDFADFSNSAFDFMTSNIKNKTIYYTTTNGTKAIKLGESKGTVAIASFINLPAISEWLINKGQKVLILCAGWKNNFCIEDSLCAGALVKMLINNDKFVIDGDSALTSLILWQSNSNPSELIKKSSHYKRLEKLGYENVLSYSLDIGRSNSIPVLIEGRLTNLNK